MPVKTKKKKKQVAKTKFKRIVESDISFQLKVKEVKREFVITNEKGMQIFVSLGENEMALTKPVGSSDKWMFKNEPTKKNIQKWRSVVSLLDGAVSLIESKLNK